MRRLYNQKTARQLKLNNDGTIDFLGRKIFPLTTAITSGVTPDATGAVAGDWAFTTHATGRNKWFYSDGTNWVASGDGNVTPGVAVPDAAALTSTDAAGANPTKAEFDALRADVVAVRTTVNALIASLEGAGLLATS